MGDAHTSSASSSNEPNTHGNDEYTNTNNSNTNDNLRNGEKNDDKGYNNALMSRDSYNKMLNKMRNGHNNSNITSKDDKGGVNKAVSMDQRNQRLGKSSTGITSNIIGSSSNEDEDTLIEEDEHPELSLSPDWMDVADEEEAALEDAYFDKLLSELEKKVQYAEMHSGVPSRIHSSLDLGARPQDLDHPSSTTTTLPTTSSTDMSSSVPASSASVDTLISPSSSSLPRPTASYEEEVSNIVSKQANEVLVSVLMDLDDHESSNYYTNDHTSKTGKRDGSGESNSNGGGTSRPMSSSSNSSSSRSKRTPDASATSKPSKPQKSVLFSEPEEYHPMNRMPPSPPHGSGYSSSSPSNLDPSTLDLLHKVKALAEEVQSRTAMTVNNNNDNSNDNNSITIRESDALSGGGKRRIASAERTAKAGQSTGSGSISSRSTTGKNDDKTSRAARYRGVSSTKSTLRPSTAHPVTSSAFSSSSSLSSSKSSRSSSTKPFDPNDPVTKALLDKIKQLASTYQLF